jgi:hypothetical protein
MSPPGVIVNVPPFPPSPYVHDAVVVYNGRGTLLIITLPDLIIFLVYTLIFTIAIYKEGL